MSDDIRTTPAKLDAPDNQEALAGEGVEGLVERLNLFTTCGCGDDDWPLLRHDTVAALSRTPSSPQADVADVERKPYKRTLLIEFADEAEAVPTAAVYREDGREVMRCSIRVPAIATMATRPAGVEEVVQVVAWLRSGDENDLIARRIADAIERGEHRAALTKPLPKEGEEARLVLAEMLAHIPDYEGDDPRAVHYQRKRRGVEYAIRALSLPVSGEVERLRTALDSIACGGTYSIRLFEARMRGKRSLTWHAVNVLQEGLAAAQRTAEAALTPQQATEERA